MTSKTSNSRPAGSSRGQYHPRIARRLLLYVVLVSSLIALGVTSIQLLSEYRHDMDRIDSRFQQIRESYLPTLAGTLWELEMDQIQVQLDCIVRLPDMEFAQIRTKHETITSGKSVTAMRKDRTFPVIYNNGREDVRLGTLEVAANLKGVYSRLLGEVWFLLIGNGIKTFIVSVFIMFLFNRLVTRHLVKMSDYARGLRVGRLDEPLELPRSTARKNEGDEFGQVVAAVNEMRENLRSELGEHEQAERALRRSQRWFSAFMDNIPGVAFMKDREGRYRYVNHQLAEVFGLTPEQMLGKTAADVADEELTRQIEQDEKAVLAAGKPTQFIHTLNSIHGPQRWLNVRFPIAQADGEEPILGVVGLNVTKYKQAEDALRESEAKYRLLIESSWELILAVDAEGRLLLVNKAAAEAVGKAPEQLEGKTIWDIINKKSADVQIARIRQVIRTGQKDIGDTLNVINGRERWLRTTICPIRDHTGQVAYAMMVANDITESVVATQALRDSEERFRLTFENAVDAILWADPATGTITNCNKAAERLLGWPRDEVIGRHFSTLHPPEERGKHEQSIAKSAKGKGVSHVYGTVLSRDGRNVPVHIAASLITVGSEQIVQGTFRDLTEVHQAWKAVRLSQQQLQMVVSNVPLLLLLADTGGVIQFADGRALSSLGRTDEQLIGHRILDVLQDSPAMDRAVRTALAGRDSVTAFELSGRVFNMRLSPLRSETGQIIGLVGVATDITARRKAEAALEAARLKLMLVREEEQKRVARELHDSIGQQLVALKISLASAGLSEQSHHCGELIQEIRRLCHDLYPPSLEALGLASGINQLGRHYEQVVKFEFEYPPELAAVRFDPEKEIALFRVAQEAVNNAVRHGKANEVRLKLARADGQVTLAVIDDGCGFDIKAKVGKGIGLRSMADRVHAVGGRIDFDSGPGGTTVFVRVPIELGAPAEQD